MPSGFDVLARHVLARLRKERGEMRTDIWENLISLRSHEEPDFTVLPPPAAFKDKEEIEEWLNVEELDVETALRNDTCPLPETKDREGYFGNRHFNYWLSGLRDRHNLLKAVRKYRVRLRSYLDIGCASGRVIRHFACNDPQIKVYGCDINRMHVEWVQRYLPKHIIAFQNTALPILPLPDSSIDLVSAFSVFTHIETFEMAWLMEIRRILRPGGMAWISVHTEHTWEQMRETWPLYRALRNHPEFQKYKGKPMEKDRLVFRWRSDKSYSSNVFYRTDYIRSLWGRLFEVKEIRHRHPRFQDVVILKKPRKD